MAVRAQLPAKLYYRIGEVAGIVGVEPHVLRYWETEFRSIRPQKSAKGQRVYSRRDVETLLKVKELLYSHRFTIAGARRKLREGGIEPPAPDAGASSEEVQRMRTALVEIRTEVIALMDELERV
ncbi:transcriptional regulator, MerR family [Sorangium cellulosum So ce56]|uniref:Transcriptional regulator, MerR family n=1 Tax=Sorangium cellulosum (strain So ce56) TaxID=448385 RepID=A9FZQ9_SORC5|nr:transcriptional regulator, MerR family [Sorangium cellulosum So ce56]